MEFTSADGHKVCVPDGSHVADHGVVTLFGEAVQRTVVGGPGLKVMAVDMGRVIGTDACVPTTDLPYGAKVYYARRNDRPGHSRMVHGVSPLPCSTLTIVLGWDDEASHFLAYTAYVGSPAPREPWDPNLSEEEVEESQYYWGRHALVDDGSTVLTVHDGDRVPDEWLATILKTAQFN